MGEYDVSRRSFLKGIGLAGLSAGTLGTLGATGIAFADDAPVAESVDAYRQLACETALVPVKKAACPGPRGPVGFEDRDIAASDIASTEDCDIVVVGAGIAGLMASLKAAEEGAKVICIEKMTKGRGCFECFGAVGAKCQEGTEIDKVALLDEMYRSAYWRVRPEPIRTYVDRSGEATDFWQAELDKGQNGFVISKVEQAPSTCGMPALTPLIDTELGFYDSPSLPPDAGVRSGYSGIYVCLEMQEVAKAYDNLDLRFSTPGVQLVRDGSGRVGGVIAKSGDEYVQINAGKGVILATGDIGGNQEMVDAFCPISNRSDSNCYAPAGFNNGDGLLMGMWAGAAMSKSEAAPMIHQFTLDTLEFNLTSFIMSWLAVNANGERYGAEMPFEPMLTNARMNTPGNVAWSIFYSYYETYIMQQQPERYDRFTDGLDAVMEKWLGNGKLIKADTLDDLAKQLDIPADTFKATVERYNSMAEAGEDVDFDVPAQWLAPVKTAPFYATKNVCSTLTIPFGLHVNADSQVLTAEDEPIPGLFAIGNVQGDFFGKDYPVHCPGVSHGRCVTFGQLVGEACAKDTTIGELDFA